MFNILKVVLNNFKSFKGEHTLNLLEVQGMVFLTGKNEKTPSLMRNGAGKTSLIDAISWCWYGKTSDGVKGNEVINRECKTCSVTVYSIVGDQECIVQRTQSPNLLTLNSQVIENDVIPKTIRLSYEAFCYSILIPQNGQMFFDLSPTEKLNLFSDILGLNYWVELSDKAAVECKKINSKFNEIYVKNASLKGNQESLNNTLTQLKDKSSVWEDEQRDVISSIAISIEGTTGQRTLTEKAIKAKNKELKKLQPKLNSLEQEINALGQQIDVTEEVKQEVMTEYKLIDADINRLKKEKEKLLNLKGTCSLCLQDIDPDHVKLETVRLESELKELFSKKEILTDERLCVDEELAKLNTQRNYLIGQFHNLTDEKDELVKETSNLEWNFNSYQRNIEGLKISLEEEKQRKNTYQELIQDKQQQLEDISNLIEENLENLNILEQQLKATEYWVSNFKKIRLLIIEEVLLSLEIEVNNNLESLGLVKWKIEFDIERENKSGGVTKGFSVLVYDPDAEKPIKWETFSGGESQLLRLAGALGLSNLILERAGLISKIEVYDEPSTHVSNVTALVETLHRRVVEQNKTIILVDHSAIEYPFDATLTVIKDENGSRIQ